jgi:hypothetical protein
MTFATSKIIENLRKQVDQAAWLFACTEDGFPPEEEMDRLFPPVFSNCRNCGKQGICRSVKSYFAPIDDEVCEECFTLLRKAFRAILDNDEEMLADCEMEFSSLGIHAWVQAQEASPSTATQWKN